MLTLKVGVREFRERIATFLESDTLPSLVAARPLVCMFRRAEKKPNPLKCRSTKLQQIVLLRPWRVKPMPMSRHLSNTCTQFIERPTTSCTGLWKARHGSACATAMRMIWPVLPRLWHSTRHPRKQRMLQDRLGLSSMARSLPQLRLDHQP